MTPSARSQRMLLVATALFEVSRWSRASQQRSVLSIAGVALWPGVGLHAFMSIWCVLSLRTGDGQG